MHFAGISDAAGKIFEIFRILLTKGDTVERGLSSADLSRVFRSAREPLGKHPTLEEESSSRARGGQPAGSPTALWSGRTTDQWEAAPGTPTSAEPKAGRPPDGSVAEQG